MSSADQSVVAIEHDTVLVVRAGQMSEGRPTEEWLNAIRVFHNDQSLHQISNGTAIFSAEELAWVELIATRAEIWPEKIDYLRRPFPTVVAPESVAIILGNVGGNDAFVAESRNIAFDVSKLFSIYGPADAPSNSDRIDRFFAHEFTHLLHKEWRRVRQPAIETPLERALWACLVEGLGNYRSLSSRWTESDGRLSLHAEKVLSGLQPILVERLSLLATSSDDQVGSLMQGLSLAPFEEKWGALPVALWLSQEVREDDDALRKWVEAGPWGVLDLAAKYLPGELAGRLPVHDRSAP